MPGYEFRCSACSRVAVFRHGFGDDTFAVTHRCVCGDVMTRVVSPPAFKRSMPDHYNQHVGSYVRNQTDLEDKLKYASDSASERTGVEHDYRLADRDPTFFGVTEEGLDATRRRRAELGLT